MEIDRKGLVEEYSEPNFNPINFLAQFLMRNNPKHEPFPEQNPYISGMRKVAVLLSQKVTTTEQLRLQELRSAIEKRKAEVSMTKLQRASEFDQRMSVFAGQFSDWGISAIDGIVESTLLEAALKAFVERYNESLLEIYSSRAQQFLTSLSEKIKQSGLNAMEYSKLLATRSTSMTPEVFNLFVTHVSNCAAIYRRETESLRISKTLESLFNKLDIHKSGRVDRDKVIAFLQQLYENVPRDRLINFVRPSDWPVVHVEEDLSSEEVILLDVELSCSDLFEDDTPIEEPMEMEGEEVEGEEGGEGEGDGEGEGEGEEEEEEEEEEVKGDETVAKEDDEGEQPEKIVEQTAENSKNVGEPSETPEESPVNAEAPVESAQDIHEPVVDYTSYSETKLVTATMTIEPASGDVAKSNVIDDSRSAPPKRQDKLPPIDPNAVSAMQPRPPARIGTVLDEDEASEEKDKVPDLPANASMTIKIVLIF